MSDAVRIGLQFDARQLEYFAGRLPKSLAYAAQEAIRSTALRVQQVLFDRVRSFFTIRNPRLFFGAGTAFGGGVAARITTFPSAREGRLWAEIEGGSLGPRAAIEGNRRLLFGMFETGGVRRPFTPGARSVAEPVLGAARPSKAEPVRPELNFAGLRLEAYYRSPGSKLKQAKIVRRTRSRKAGAGLLGEFGRVSLPGHDQGIQWKGRQRSFIAFTASLPFGGVFQRTGPGSVRLLWAFEPPFAIPAGLHWLETARAAAPPIFHAEVDRQIADTLEHDLNKLVAA